MKKKSNRKLRAAFARAHDNLITDLLKNYHKYEQHLIYVGNYIVERMNDFLSMASGSENSMTELVFFTKHNTTGKNMLDLMKEHLILCDQMFEVIYELLTIYHHFLYLNGMTVQDGIILKDVMLEALYERISIIRMSYVYEEAKNNSYMRQVAFRSIALATPGFRYATDNSP